MQTLNRLYDIQLALIQIAATMPMADGTELDFIYLVHVTQMNQIPTALKALLTDKSISKAGRNVGGDFNKISRDWKVVPESPLELGRLCRERGLVENGAVGLEALTIAAVGQRLVKDAFVRASGWDKELTAAQKDYAAKDVWASLLVARAALLRADHTAHLTPQTAVAGVEVDIMVKTTAVAKGVITADTAWGGHSLADRRPIMRVVVRVSTIHSPAATVFVMPQKRSTVDGWPAIDVNERGRRVSPTLAEVWESCQQAAKPFTMLVPLSRLRLHIS